ISTMTLSAEIAREGNSHAWTVQATAPHHAHQSAVSSDGESSSALMRRWLSMTKAIRQRAFPQVDIV
ncbi:hypothetical protein C7B63_20920, partial [Bacillus halotolerans]|uniref:hypothetical protein n=1 Tax=Bacillus halotolerans TaxID=260554 RepID=UPI000D4AEA3C